MRTKNLKVSLLIITLFTCVQINAQDKNKEKPSPEKMFENLDTNKDKAISLEEFKTRKTKRELKPEAQEKIFTKMDTDSNGSVNLKEFITAAE